MKKPPAFGIVVVHGINNSLAERQAMQGWLLDRMAAYGLFDRMVRVSGGSPEPALCSVTIGQWDSTGNGLKDIFNLYNNAGLRRKAIGSVKASFLDAQDDLYELADQKSRTPYLLVVGHSMGQVLSTLALMELSRDPSFQIPVYLLTFGGPLGNGSPAFRLYLRWATSQIPGCPPCAHKWVDVFNPDDGVPHHPLFGSRAYPGSQHVVFQFLGKPPLWAPFQEHGSYFEDPFCYGLMEKALLELETASAI